MTTNLKPIQDALTAGLSWKEIVVAQHVSMSTIAKAAAASTGTHKKVVAKKSSKTATTIPRTEPWTEKAAAKIVYITKKSIRKYGKKILDFLREMKIPFVTG